MAYRILFIFFGIILAVNIVLSVVGLIFGVNLYQKYTKQILIFFASLIFLIFNYCRVFYPCVHRFSGLI